MKRKDHFIRFGKDHMWIVILFCVVPIGFFVLYGYFENAAAIDIVYYCTLDVLVLLGALIWRLYATWQVYELYGIGSDQVSDYQIVQPRSSQEKEIQQLLQTIKMLNHREINRMEAERKNQKLILYQWVHQIKTPLSVMKLLMDQHIKDKEYIQITKGIRQIEYHMSQILYVYELDAIGHEFQVEQVSLYEICKKSINELKDFFISRQVYPKLCVAKDVQVYSDTKWLSIILFQLLTNAVKYSHSGQAVTISSFQTGQRIQLDVKDEGIGIPSADQARIFQLFFVGKNGRKKGKSSGLGLYIAKCISEYLGHQIAVNSVEAKGSTFSIVFENRRERMDERKMTKL